MFGRFLDLSPSSQGNRFRAQRVKLLLKLVDNVIAKNGRCRILDVGGTANFWATWGRSIDWAKTSVTCVNLDLSPALDGKDNSAIAMIEGDACNLKDMDDQSFDVVFSNSVIEHVGLWRRQKAMADEIRRVGKSYFIQTPYFWFPVEPHLRTLFIHWLPQSIATRMMLRKKRGFWDKAQNMSDATIAVQAAILLDQAQMRALFPDARMQNETFFGLTKSLIAIRDCSTASEFLTQP